MWRRPRQTASRCASTGQTGANPLITRCRRTATPAAIVTSLSNISIGGCFHDFAAQCRGNQSLPGKFIARCSELSVPIPVLIFAWMWHDRLKSDGGWKLATFLQLTLNGLAV